MNNPYHSIPKWQKQRDITNPSLILLLRKINQLTSENLAKISLTFEHNHQWFYSSIFLNGLYYLWHHFGHFIWQFIQYQKAILNTNHALNISIPTHNPHDPTSNIQSKFHQTRKLWIQSIHPHQQFCQYLLSQLYHHF